MRALPRFVTGSLLLALACSEPEVSGYRPDDRPDAGAGGEVEAGGGGGGAAAPCRVTLGAEEEPFRPLLPGDHLAITEHDNLRFYLHLENVFDPPYDDFRTYWLGVDVLVGTEWQTFTKMGCSGNGIVFPERPVQGFYFNVWEDPPRPWSGLRVRFRANRTPADCSWEGPTDCDVVTEVTGIRIE